MPSEFTIAPRASFLSGMANDSHNEGVEPSLTHWTGRLAAGDELAWEWFHGRYYLPLLRQAVCLSGNPSAAEEIVQQTYLRAARHLKPFTDEAAFWAWLRCVLRCVVIDHGRQARRRSLLLEKFAHWRALHSAGEAASDGSAEAAALLAEAMAKLPADDADLLRRCYCEGWSAAELGSALGTTPKAIEHRLARLRQRLRDAMLRLR